MPSCAAYTNKFFKFFDLFKYGSFIRYNTAPAYSTFSGGFISFAVIIILIVLFYNVGVETIRKELIFTTTKRTFSNDPSSLTVTLSP